jgi:uncharacterized phiE125 gp8 family phage protein
MARYWLGQPVTVSTTVRDRTGAPIDAGTLTLVVKIRNADGTTTITGTYASPAHDSTGNYHQDIPASDLTAIAHYQYTWTATGTGAGVSVGDFDVADPDEISVLPLQDAKDQLIITTTVSDARIQAWIATIESSLERMTGGPLVNRTVTERAEMLSGQTVIVVRQRPLVSVTQILGAGGTAIDISGGLDLDVNAGTIRRKLGLPFYGPFFTWLPQVTVIAVAGWGVAVPAAFSQAAMIILQHLYESRRGPGSIMSGAAATEMVTPPGFGFAIPRMAAELLNGAQNGVPFVSEAYI